MPMYMHFPIFFNRYYMKSKYIFLFFFIAIIVSGVYAINQTGDDTIKQDSSIAKHEFADDTIIQNPELTQEEEQNRSKSNLLLSRDSNRGEFSLLTILRGLLGKESLHPSFLQRFLSMRYGRKRYQHLGQVVQHSFSLVRRKFQKRQ